MNCWFVACLVVELLDWLVILLVWFFGWTLVDFVGCLRDLFAWTVVGSDWLLFGCFVD